MDKNLASLFQNRAYKYRSRPLLGSKSGNHWHWMSWDEAAASVEKAGRALISLGIQPQDKVAILAENRVEWILADLAIQSVGAVSVPIYTTSATEQVEYILAHSGARVVLVSALPSNPTFQRDIHANLTGLAGVEKIVAFDLVTDYAAHPKWLFWDNFLGLGAAVPAQDFYARIEGVGAQSISTIIYTSGTTGRPKGVMLTHFNIITNCHYACKEIPADDTDMTVSFLPLSHAFERTGGFYGMLHIGARIAYAQSINTIAQDIQETHPTLLFCVPRILEKIHGSVWDEVQRRPGIVRQAFRHALALADRQGRLGPFERALFGLYRRAFFAKIMQKLGGRTRFIIAGGAKLNPKIASFFGQIGIPVYQGYGLTETSPVISVNGPGKNKIGSVGQPIKGADVKIAEDGEILVRGALIMKGYYKDEKATADVMDSNGFFHTGDIGHLDEEGYLFITDRKKELIVTSGGKKIAPQAIENLLQESPWIEQACVVGEGEKYLSAILVPNRVALGKWAAEKGWTLGHDGAGLDRPDVRALFQSTLDTVNGQLAAFETVKKFILSDKEFSIERDLLTPTLKLKRKNILSAYAEPIARLYAEALPSGEK